MHGTLRFVLALTVALSHLGVTVYGYNPGVMAVVAFYILAGMVAYKLNFEYYLNKPYLYYKDRIRRIFPLYIVVLILAYTVYIFGAQSYFLSKTPSFIDHLSNIFVIPLSYYMYTDIDKFTLIPPAWSLGVELQFYLLAPFILLKLNRIILLLVFSLFIYILASTGVLNTDYFGYRLLVGVMFIFLIGALIQSREYTRSKTLINIYLISVYFVLVILSIYTFISGYKAPFNHETLMSLLFFIPFLAYTQKVHFKAVDKKLGAISYPVFLVHFPVLWMFEVLGYAKNNTVMVVLVTIIISYLLHEFVEKKLLKLAKL